MNVFLKVHPTYHYNDCRNNKINNQVTAVKWFWKPKYSYACNIIYFKIYVFLTKIKKIFVIYFTKKVNSRKQKYIASRVTLVDS